MLKPVLGSQIQLGHPLANGLVGLWLMNENCGNIIQDLSGNSNHAPIVGASWVASEIGPALYSNATLDTNVTIPLSGLLDEVTFYFILSANEDMDTSGDERLLEGNEGFTTTFMIYLNDGDRWQYLSSSNPITLVSKDGLTWKANKLHHLVYAMKRGEHKIAIDGVIDGTSNDTDGVNITTGILRLGGLHSGNHPKFTIACFSCYNRALSVQEIQQAYRNPFGMFEEEM